MGAVFEHVAKWCDQMMKVMETEMLLTKETYQLHVCEGKPLTKLPGMSLAGPNRSLCLSLIKEASEVCPVCKSLTVVDHTFDYAQFRHYPKIFCVGRPGIDFPKILDSVDTHEVLFIDEIHESGYDAFKAAEDFSRRNIRYFIAGVMGIPFLLKLLGEGRGPDIVVFLKNSMCVEDEFIERCWRSVLERGDDLLFHAVKADVLEPADGGD